MSECRDRTRVSFVAVLVIVMSILLQAVDAELHKNSPTRVNKAYVITEDTLYSDDTLLIAENPDALQTHLYVIAHIGKSFGLELDVGKTVLLKV
eukprot:4111509-Pyramimonas_sp.AAC.1